MTEQQYRESHEEFMRCLDVLDRHYAPDAPESPEEIAWLDKRMKEIELFSPHGKTIRPLLKQDVSHEAHVPSLFSF